MIWPTHISPCTNCNLCIFSSFRAHWLIHTSFSHFQIIKFAGMSVTSHKNTLIIPWKSFCYVQYDQSLSYSPCLPLIGFWNIWLATTSLGLYKYIVIQLIISQPHKFTGKWGTVYNRKFLSCTSSSFQESSLLFCSGMWAWPMPWSCEIVCTLPH